MSTEHLQETLMKHRMMTGARVGMTAAVMAAGVLFAANAQAAGCLSGGAVGGVAGHVAGHHAVLGAVGGCAVGHHMAKKKEREAQAQQAQTPPPKQ
jgi:hypothetical protein